MASHLIRDGTVMFAADQFEEGYIFVSGDQIEDMGKGDPPKGLVEKADQVIGAHGKVVLPGLVNAHTHLSQTFMRGLAAGRTFQEWLRDVIWPLEAAMSVQQLKVAAMLGMIENLHGGVTHVIDHHKVTKSPSHTDAVCQAAVEVGVRLTLARGWADLGAKPDDQAELLEDFQRLLEAWGGSSDHLRPVRIASGPMALWRCSPEMLQRMHSLATASNTLTHIHVSETANEVEEFERERECRPIEWLDRLGLLDENLQAVHAVWVDAAEIELLKRRRAVVIHCPVSNAVLGNGIAPLTALVRMGVPIRLGTDGAASNDTNDIFETGKFALAIARGVERDPAAISPSQTLDMLTAGCRLRPGERADIILVDLDTIHATPAHDLPSALLLCARAGDVETVMVGGQVVMQGRQLLTVDERAVLQEARAMALGLQERL